MAGEAQGIQGSGSVPLWADMYKKDAQPETEREKLQKTDVWTYAAQQAGAYMSSEISKDVFC